MIDRINNGSIREITNFIYRKTKPITPRAGTFYWIENGEYDGSPELWYAFSDTKLARLDSSIQSILTEDENIIISEKDSLDRQTINLNYGVFPTVDETELKKGLATVESVDEYTNLVVKKVVNDEEVYVDELVLDGSIYKLYKGGFEIARFDTDRVKNAIESAESSIHNFSINGKEAIVTGDINSYRGDVIIESSDIVYKPKIDDSDSITIKGAIDKLYEDAYSGLICDETYKTDYVTISDIDENNQQTLSVKIGEFGKINGIATVEDVVDYSTLLLVDESGNISTEVKADGSKYILKQGSKEIASFNIEKDSFLKEAELVYKHDDSYTSEVNDEPYIHLILKTTDDTQEDDEIYLSVADFLKNELHEIDVNDSNKFINISEKKSHKQTLSVNYGSVSEDVEGIAIASEVKSYVDDKDSTMKEYVDKCLDDERNITVQDNDVILDENNKVIKFIIGNKTYYSQAVLAPEPPTVSSNILYAVAGNGDSVSLSLGNKIGETYYKVDTSSTITSPNNDNISEWSNGTTVTLTDTNFLTTSSDTGVEKYVHCVNMSQGLISSVRNEKVTIKRKLANPTASVTMDDYSNSRSLVATKNSSNGETTFMYSNNGSSWSNVNNAVYSNNEKTEIRYVKEILTGWIDSDSVSKSIIVSKMQIFIASLATKPTTSMSSFDGWTGKNKKEVSSEDWKWKTPEEGSYYPCIAIPKDYKLIATQLNKPVNFDGSKITVTIPSIGGNKYDIYCISKQTADCNINIKVTK